MNDATPRCAVPGSACRLLQLETPGTRPVWAVLDAAGARHFTGEIVLLTEPQVVVHFTGGEAYIAERTGDPSLADRLVAMGVVDHDQLDRGVVRLGAIEHLGRLFDRVPELDRHQVELALEVITAEVLGEIADHPVDEIRVASYRHHPSGVQRWSRTSPVVASTEDGPTDDVFAAAVDALPSDVALVAEYEQLLADHPPTDQFEPTIALPSLGTLEPLTVEPLTVEPVAVEPAAPVELPATDATEWAVESTWEWPADTIEPAPEPEPASIWDLPVEGTAADGPNDAPSLELPAFDVPVLDPSAATPVAQAPASADTGLQMPEFDLASILQQVRESEGGPSLPAFPEDEAPVDDDVRAAVRAALAEIEAAARGQAMDETLPAFALDPVTAPEPSGSGPLAATATVAPAPVVPTLPTLPVTPRLPNRPTATPPESDPLAAAIASVAADLPSAVEAAGSEQGPDAFEELTPPPAPRTDEMPAGGLRRLIGGIRKP